MNRRIEPPENKLMLDNRQLSEHELRVQRSLTKLNVPDWYKSYGRSGTASGGATPTSAPAGTTGTTLGSRNKLYGSGTGLAGGWSGLSSSKTNSLTSLQSAGRYSGRSSSALGSSSRNRATTATPSGGGRSSRESLMSPSSTASVSPSPYYERSSFTYGMPYALTRFAGARMSCGASPASLSPSPSPVGGVAGSSTSTPVTSAPLSRHHSYSKAPYLGWRSQERLAGKNLYRTPAERLAADLLVQKQRASPLGGGSSGGGGGSGTTSSSTEVNTLEKKMELTETEGSSTKTGTVSASSDLSLNNSEESSSKLHRVRSSIKEVSNAIVDYVNETKDVNGSVSPRRGYIWLETAFVGTKPIDSPGTPDTPSIMMNNNSRSEAVATTTTASNNKPEVFRFDEQVSSSRSATSGTGGPSQFALAAHRMRSEEDSYASAANNGVATYGARNEQTEERSNSSSVSSPTMEDILDSLLALRRPNKKSRSKSKGVKDSGKGAPPPPPPRLAEAPPPPPNMESDWQERMNQPLDDTAFFPTTDEYFSTTTQLTSVVYPEIDDNEEAPLGGGTLNDAAQMCESHVDDEGKDGDDNSYGFNSKSEPLEHIEKESRRKKKEEQYYTQESPNNPAAAARMTSMLSYELGVSSRDVYPASPGDSKSKDEAAGGDEDAFGSPGEILPAAVNVGGTNDSSSNPSTPAKRRVSFDLDVSDKEEKSSSRSRRESESVAGTISCRNSKCGKSAAGLEARREFKTCHNCNAYYCSRECRRAHWEKHKKVCMQSRVGALCKQIINHVKEDGFAVQQLSGVARRGVLAKGRGCVKLFFSSPDRAERFLTGGYPELPEPWYISSGDILPEEMGAQTFSELLDQCKTYNTDSRFIVYVSVCVVNEVPTSGAVKWEREMISRSAKLRLQMPKSYQESQMHHQAASALSLFPVEDGDESSGGVVVPPPVPPRDSSTVLTSTAAAVVARPTVSPPPPPVPPSSGSHEIILLESPNGDDDTLILKSVPPPTFHTLSGSETRRLREVSFANIQRHLQERGVDLRQIYPEIYTKLCNYVEHDETFLPVTIYPRNLKTGRNFMCVIMPDFTTSADTTIQHMPNPLHQILTGTVETINVALEFSSDYHLR